MLTELLSLPKDEQDTIVAEALDISKQYHYVGVWGALVWAMDEREKI